MTKSIEISERLSQLIEISGSAIERIEYPKEPKELYEPIIYTMSSGGKRIRPLLTLLGYYIYNSNIDIPKGVTQAALAIEMFHNFTLLHDDIMDKASVRRGRETVHVKWDENVAILSGDAMLSYSYRLLAESDPKYLKEILDIFNSVSINIYEGQQYDMLFESRDDVTLEEYIEMITLKTAVLLSGAITIGATLSGASKEDLLALKVYATKLGLAFQVQDDLLDTYGNTQTFGKEVGGDIESAKKTFLLISFFSRATKEDRSKMKYLLADINIDRAQKLKEAISLYDKYEVKDITEQMITQYFNEATDAIDSLSCKEEGKELLRLLATKLINRDK